MTPLRSRRFVAVALTFVAVFALGACSSDKKAEPTKTVTNGEITIDGFYDNVEPPTNLELGALAELPVDVERVKQELGLDALDAPRERSFNERLARWPTLTINGLHGGYGGPGSKTVLPHAAVAKCSRVVRNRMSGQRSRVSSRFTRVGAR